MTHTELAWEFAGLFAELSDERLNELISKNVPLETLEFFHSYAESFAVAEGLDRGVRDRVPNLLLVGYLIRLLEERLLDGEGAGSGSIGNA